MSRNVKQVRELLRSTKVSVAPQTFTLVSLSHSDWEKLLDRRGQSPRMTAPFLIFVDPHEVTLVLDQVDLEAVQPTYLGGKVEGGYRLLTFDIVLDLSVVGFIAEVARLLAEAEVPILPISAFSRDHILIKQQHLARALKALGDVVGELC